MVEGARLESEYGSKAHPGFESLPLRHLLCSTQYGDTGKQDFGAVLGIIGPRQSDKTTLGQSFGHDRRFISLDDPATRTAALTDPVGLIRYLDRAIIDEIQCAPDLPRFLRMLAALNGQPVNARELGGRLKIDRKTASRYLALAEQIFVVRTLPAWSNNSVKRLMQAPKLHFVVSGLAAMLTRVTAAQLDHDKTPFGNLLESFVLAELEKQCGWSQGCYDFSHFRDLNGREVDIVVEDSSGRLAGIEAKASATVTAKDFAGPHEAGRCCGRQICRRRRFL